MRISLPIGMELQASLSPKSLKPKHLPRGELYIANEAGPATLIFSYFRITSGESARGQGRDCVGLFGEDRIRIPKPPWRALDREKTGMTAFDPPETNAVIRRERSRRSCLIEGSISAPGRKETF